MRAGDVIGNRFEVERQAGAGGMGVVFRARDRLSGEAAAIKVLQVTKKTDLERFEREAKVLAELKHPAIVRYLSHGTAATGEPYLAMQWLEGHDLFAHLKKDGLPIAEVVAVLRRVAGALAEAHARGVVHRDIKPSNVFLVDADPARATILDFGVARLSNTTMTRSGIVVGTPGYMSPEQARGEPGVDARSDVFSLGCVAFECVVGAPPFVGEHVMAVLAKVLLEDAPRVRSLREDVPSVLDALIARMLSKDPSLRPENGAAVELALAALERSEEAGVGPLSSIRSMPASLTHGEQQLFSIVLVRPAGAGERTETAPTLTPEQASAQLVEARAEVEALGGRVEALVDGSILATLSATAAKGAASDRAVIAARCALAMRRLLPDASIALATGRGARTERLLVGAVVDRAASLLSKLEGGGDVRLDDVTAGLLDARFDIGGDDRGLVLRGERERVEATRTLLGRPTPCVGRERDLASLVALFDECISEPVARVALVTGPSGLGKSRVRHELLKLVGDRAAVWLGRGDVVSQGSPFGLIAPAIRRAALVLEGEPIEVRRRKLRARVDRSVPAPDAERVTAFLGELIGTPFPDEGMIALRSARADPMLMGDQMRRAWEDFLAAETEMRPVLIVLEDLHWGDLPSVKLIDLALRNLHDRPWMVLAIARPEVHTVFPALWSGRNVQEIRLGELSRKAAEKLVRSVLGDDVPTETVARILERAAGNPLFLEEILRAFAEGKGDALPESVLAMLEARLSALDAETRRVLRAASIYGQVFWESAVASLVAPDVRRHLSTLVDREVIARLGPGRFAETEYSFRHSSVREAAYAMLTEQDRVLGHSLAGEWLERAGETEAVVLAEHFERGGAPMRAVKWYRLAAAQALEGNDLAATIARAERGISCGATGASRGELRALQADAHSWRAEHAAGQRCAEEAVALLPRGSTPWFVAAAELAVTSQRLGHVDRLDAIAEELCELWPLETATPPRAVAVVRIAAQLLFAGRHALVRRLFDLIESAHDSPASTDPEVRGWVKAVRAIRETISGNAEVYLTLMQEAVACYQAAHDVRNVCLQSANVGYGLLEMGLYERAEVVLRESIAAADRMDLRNVSTAARTNHGLALARLGKLQAGRDVERAVVDELAAAGDKRMEGSARIYLALILLASGDLAEAQREASQAVNVLNETPPLRSYALGALARIRLARGDLAAASEASHEAIAILRSLGGLDDGESFVRLVHAEILEESGDLEGAREAFAVAHERLLTRASTIVDPGVRRAFLEAVPEHARTIELAGRAQTS